MSDCSQCNKPAPRYYCWMGKPEDQSLPFHQEGAGPCPLGMPARWELENGSSASGEKMSDPALFNDCTCDAWPTGEPHRHLGAYSEDGNHVPPSTPVWKAGPRR